DAVVAADAPGLLEDAEPFLLQRRQGGFVALEVPVEGRARGDQRALEGRDRLGDVVEVQRIFLARERGGEERLVADLPESLDRLLRREVHLDVGLDRALRLLLQGRRAAVPELRREERRVVDGRAVPRPHPRALADCDLAGIDPGRAHDVARVARDDPGPRELRLEEELVAEIDPFRRARVVFGVLGGRGERLEERGYVYGTRTFRGHRGFGYIADLAGGGPEEQCAEEKERSRFDDAGARPPSARPRLSMITRLHGHGFASDLGSAA